MKSADAPQPGDRAWWPEPGTPVACPSASPRSWPHPGRRPIDLAPHAAGPTLSVAFTQGCPQGWLSHLPPGGERTAEAKRPVGQRFKVTIRRLEMDKDDGAHPHTSVGFQGVTRPSQHGPHRGTGCQQDAEASSPQMGSGYRGSRWSAVSHGSLAAQGHPEFPSGVSGRGPGAMLRESEMTPRSTE